MSERDLRRQAPNRGLGKIEAVATASRIIDFLAESEGAVGVQQITTVLGITKSRASRHLANLELLGVVARAPGARGYLLGWRVIRWGQIAASRLSLADLLDTHLNRLRDALGHTVLLCASAGSDAIVLKCLPARSAMRIEVKSGLVLSLPQSPSARVSFAFQPRERRQQLLTYLREREPDFRIDDEEQFNAQIAEIQRSYHCWTRDKFDLGHGAVAAPVFDQNEALAAVITVMLPSDNLAGQAPPPAVLAALLNCCEHCSRLLQSQLRFPQPNPIHPERVT